MLLGTTRADAHNHIRAKRLTTDRGSLQYFLCPFAIRIPVASSWNVSSSNRARWLYKRSTLHTRLRYHYHPSEVVAAGCIVIIRIRWMFLGAY